MREACVEGPAARVDVHSSAVVSPLPPPHTDTATCTNQLQHCCPRTPLNPTTNKPQINSGQVEAAEQLLDKLLAANPNDLSALVARGTARAMNRNLKGADEDFTHAIQLEPR